MSGHKLTRRDDRNDSFSLQVSAALMAPIHLHFILNSLREAFKFIPIHWWLCPVVTEHMVLLVFLCLYNGYNCHANQRRMAAKTFDVQQDSVGGN